MAIIPQPEWTRFSHRTIFHGRQVCFARKPNCEGCLLAEMCPKIGVGKKIAARKPKTKGKKAVAKASKRALRPAKRRGAKS